jgi:hypothetical protein
MAFAVRQVGHHGWRQGDAADAAGEGLLPRDIGGPMKLAQLNIARLRFPLDSPQLKDFVDALPEINGLAEASPGFV